MNFGDKLLLLYSIIATSAFQLNGLPPFDQLFQAVCVFQLEAFSQWKDFLSFFSDGCKGKRAKNLSCTLKACDLPQYLYSNGKHIVDRQKEN